MASDTDEFQPGDIVRLINNKTHAARIGALAVVQRRVKIFGRNREGIDIIWLRENGLARDQRDGAYYADEFKLHKTQTLHADFDLDEIAKAEEIISALE